MCCVTNLPACGGDSVSETLASDGLVYGGDGTVTPTDVRDSSRFFVVYETGDNRTTAYGEAEPLDLFYGTRFLQRVR